ncbi:MAG: 4-hydroxy-tetrahydrodipicolinate synthase [Candidatus Altiarchaeales archaeon ex4484_2]|nr:MAG: 4-hydroxy-tetrahydrodipicolinate synthase [Candidatus Altiarchaeales archaeon ex4484_2]
MKLGGLYTALITPFDEEGDLDINGFRKNIRRQIDDGVDGIVPVGTTGESATLSSEEHKIVVETAVEEANGKIKVIAGTGSNNTSEALEYTQHAMDAGADAALVITPYYNKPTQRGLIKHYTKIASHVDIPLVVYTVPGRTGVNIQPETTIELSRIENIVAIKDASGNLDQVMRVLRETDDFTVLSGEDYLTYCILSLGGDGVISVASNIAPGLMSELIHSALDGDWEKARELHYRLYPLFKVLFVETNPAPAKAALDLMGLPAGEPRLPLVEVTKESRDEIKTVLKGLDLI